jgi:hypothetical protein
MVTQNHPYYPSRREKGTVREVVRKPSLEKSGVKSKEEPGNHHHSPENAAGRR